MKNAPGMRKLWTKTARSGLRSLAQNLKPCYSVLVTNMDSGNSDGSHSLAVSFSADSFTPAVSGLVGGAPMTISGSGFGGGLVSVTVCGTPCQLDASSTAFDLVCAIPARVNTIFKKQTLSFEKSYFLKYWSIRHQ